MSQPAIPSTCSFLHRTAATLLLAVLSLCIGFSGVAMSRIIECESAPLESELVEFEILVTESSCRRRAVRQALRLPGGIVSAILSSHTSEQTLYLSATAHTEHALRNGGIGTPLRC